MGREIRKVAANWEHPRKGCEHSPWNDGCGDAKNNDGKCYQPPYDQDFEAAANEWLAGCVAWMDGTHENFKDSPEDRQDIPYYWQYEGDPPDENYYRPKWAEEERTHFQIYETVSEGTPVTPHFASKKELVDYLVEHGDFWDQNRGDGGWNRKNAENFVEKEWAMSGMMIRDETGAKLYAPRDGA